MCDSKWGESGRCVDRVETQPTVAMSHLGKTSDSSNHYKTRLGFSVASQLYRQLISTQSIMSAPPPPLGDQPITDPFAGRPRRTHFQEPLQPYASTATLATPFESTATLPRFDDDDEKIPLTDQGVYPP
jgi:hypothetical protein